MAPTTTLLRDTAARSEAGSPAATSASTSAATAAAMAATGTDATVDELVRQHLPLVGHIVREVCARIPAHVNRDDLVSAGMFALATSAQSFSADRGVPFARFASIRIRGALTDELRSMDWASRGARSRAREVDSVRVELTQTLGREPSRAELSHASGLSADELNATENDTNRASVLSLQGLTPDAGAEILATRDDGPETLLLRREQVGYVRDAVAELPERLRTVVIGYFFEQRKMADIAAELGVTESRVSQMRAEGLRVLRGALQSIDEPQPAAAPTHAKAAVAHAYAAAVATRSTLAGRLAATTALCESYTDYPPMRAS